MKEEEVFATTLFELYLGLSPVQYLNDENMAAMWILLFLALFLAFDNRGVTHEYKLDPTTLE